MQAIRAIVDTYVRLRNEDALLASKQQRLKVLAMCDAGNPIFEKLRSQCLEEIAEIEAGLERLRPAPVLILPDPPPSSPPAEDAGAPADPPPDPPEVEEISDPAHPPPDPPGDLAPPLPDLPPTQLTSVEAFE